MKLVRVRRNAQITLPAEIRRALGLADGDYLEAEMTEGGVLLRPVRIVDRGEADQEKAWDDFMLGMGDLSAEEPEVHESRGEDA